MEPFIVNYLIYADYDDDSSDAKVIVGEEKQVSNLEELISNIENNDKYLLLREDDVIDFDKDLFETGLFLVVEDSKRDIKFFTRSVSGYKLAVAIHVPWNENDQKTLLSKLLGEDYQVEVGNIEEATFNALKDISSELSHMFSKPDDNKIVISEDYGGVIFLFESDKPFFAYHQNMRELSKKYDTKVEVCDLGRKYYQAYQSGEIDEGLVDGDEYQDWLYLSEDYVDLIVEAIEGTLES